MKYCQKCNVKLQDEVEECPFCGTKQIPAEEFEAKKQKKKKTKTAIAVVIAVILVVLVAAYGLILTLGKETKKIATDEEYTTELTDEQELAQFVAYAVTALPQVWESSDEDTESAIEYYKTDFPDVAAGFEILKELRPVAGAVKDISLDSVVRSEEGRYKLAGTLICEEGKVDYVLELGPSGYVDLLHFELRNETTMQKARSFLLEMQSKYL